MSSNGALPSTGDSLIRLATHRLREIAQHEISQQLKEKVSLALLDYLASIAAGLQAPWASNICRYGGIRKSLPESYAWGMGKDISAEKAAFVNAALAHR